MNQNDRSMTMVHDMAGEQIAAIRMWASRNGSPITRMVDGKPHIGWPSVRRQ
jgi:hypothetical protein